MVRSELASAAAERMYKADVRRWSDFLCGGFRVLPDIWERTMEKMKEERMSQWNFSGILKEWINDENISSVNSCNCNKLKLNFTSCIFYVGARLQENKYTETSPG